MPISGLAIIAAAVVNMIIGMAWYSKYLFGNVWLELIGKKQQDLMKNASRAYSTIYVASLVTSAMLAFFINLAQAGSVMDGMRIGFLAWLGFVATSTLAAYVFEGRPIKLYVLYNTYQLVAFLAMGAILGA